MANLLTISPFSCFSDEVLCLIFEFITSTYDLKNIMLACRRFHNLIRKRNKLWKLRLNVEKEVLDTLVSISSLSFPNGKPPLKVMDNFIVGKHPLELFEDEISKHLFHPQSWVLKFFINFLCRWPNILFIQKGKFDFQILCRETTGTYTNTHCKENVETSRFPVAWGCTYLSVGFNGRAISN